MTLLWIVVALVALSIPLAAIVLDSPVMHALVERYRRDSEEPSRELSEIAKRVGVLEEEVAELARNVGHLREETQFVQQLLEEAKQRPALPRSPSQPSPS